MILNISCDKENVLFDLAYQMPLYIIIVLEI